ncbi:MAG: GOLPH3/VPS74 family protein [Ruminococcus sp.]|jgi:hypothetical protein
MKDLSLTQKYLLCTLNRKGKVSTFELEKIMCIAASGVLELILDDIAVLKDKKVLIQKALPADKDYLRPVFAFIEKKQPVKFEKVIENFSITFTDKNINELIGCIGDSLAKAGCVKKERSGLFGGRDVYLPDEKAVDGIIQCIRAEILEDGELSEDIVALTALLNKSGDLTRYFSAYEKKDLKKRLREIKENPMNREIQRAADCVEAMFLLLVVAAT